MGLLGGVFGALGSIFSGFFRFKGDQARTVQDAIELLKSTNDMDGIVIQAHAQALAALLTGGSFLERIWRPCLMVIICSILISYWFFGYAPPYLNQPMSPMMSELFGLLKIGLVGYIPGRTVEKIAAQINLGSILKTIINKKLV